jgi:hypothetical protein
MGVSTARDQMNATATVTLPDKKNSMGRGQYPNMRMKNPEISLARGIIPAQTPPPMALQSEPTVISGILMSDVSIVEQGTQKRSVIGCFDQFVFPQFPVQIGRFWVTAWITNLAGSLSEMELTTRIEEKGSAHVVFSSSTTIKFPAETPLDPTNTMALSTPVVGVIFQKPGIYTILLLLNGEEVGKRDINVRQAPQEKTQ